MSQEQTSQASGLILQGFVILAFPLRRLHMMVQQSSLNILVLLDLWMR